MLWVADKLLLAVLCGLPAQVLTLVEGAGMAGSSVTLEAVALATSSAATD